MFPESGVTTVCFIINLSQNLPTSEWETLTELLFSLFA